MRFVDGNVFVHAFLKKAQTRAFRLGEKAEGGCEEDSLEGERKRGCDDLGGAPLGDSERARRQP